MARKPDTAPRFEDASRALFALHSRLLHTANCLFCPGRLSLVRCPLSRTRQNASVIPLRGAPSFFSISLVKTDHDHQRARCTRFNPVTRFYTARFVMGALDGLVSLSECASPDEALNRRHNDEALRGRDRNPPASVTKRAADREPINWAAGSRSRSPARSARRMIRA